MRARCTPRSCSFVSIKTLDVISVGPGTRSDGQRRRFNLGTRIGLFFDTFIPRNTVKAVDLHLEAA